MQKIAVLTIAVSIIGFIDANKGGKCAKFPTMKEVNRCCVQIERSWYDDAYDDCFEKFANTPHPEHCATACAVNKTGVGNPDLSINYNVLHNILVDFLKDTVLVDYAIAGVKVCESRVKQMMQNPPYNTPAKEQCNPGFNLMERCFASYGLLSCPLQKRPKGNAYCDKVFEDAIFCSSEN